MEQDIHRTTILGILRDGRVALGGDGQVTLGQSIVKADAHKLRRLHDGQVLAGFAGSLADAFALLERFEKSLRECHGQIVRAAVDLASQWRTDRALRRLESMLVVADRSRLLVIGGTGDVIEPSDGIAAIGSGGAQALAAARALARHTTLSPPEIVRAALQITSEICIYTSSEITVEELGA